jgi:hypothetical protein
MIISTKSTAETLLNGAAWLLFIIAGLAFLVGGRAISQFAKTERMLAEMEGMGIAIACGVLGTLVRIAVKRLGETKKACISTSETEA